MSNVSTPRESPSDVIIGRITRYLRVSSDQLSLLSVSTLERIFGDLDFTSMERALAEIAIETLKTTKHTTTDTLAEHFRHQERRTLEPWRKDFEIASNAPTSGRPCQSTI